MKNQEILNAFHENTEKWENGELGTDEKSASLVTEAEDNELQRLLNKGSNEGMGNKMQLISIRLPKTLIADLKDIGKNEGLGYQTLAKEVLTRFVESENRKKYNEMLVENERLAKELESLKKSHQKCS